MNTTKYMSSQMSSSHIFACTQVPNQRRCPHMHVYRHTYTSILTCMHTSDSQIPAAKRSAVSADKLRPPSNAQANRNAFNVQVNVQTFTNVQTFKNVHKRQNVQKHSQTSKRPKTFTNVQTFKNVHQRPNVHKRLL